MNEFWSFGMLNKTFLTFSFILLAGYTGLCAETFLVDFNTLNSTGYVGGTWNVYARPDDITGSTIVNNSGTTSAYTLSKGGTINDSGNGGTRAFNNSSGGPSWVTTDGSLTNTSAASDYFYTSTNANTFFTITFGNLTPGDIVDLDLWASRADLSSGQGTYSYSLDGGTTHFGFNVLEKDGSASTSRGWDTNNSLQQAFLAQTDGNNNARYMNMNALTIGASGTLEIKVDDNSSSNWAPLNAIRLTVIPEPSTFTFLLVAGIGVIISRRRLNV
ncbi:hypothetical protein P0Y35_04630 [Kiritimatiellaeota bacterium B1221]|nr:hypothetical protein [Kiritimatiellaeota bacterium B1221]